MRRLFLVLLLVVLFLPALPAQAQAELSLPSVDVSIWPEYDQPAVLVIYHIQLAPETSLPATLLLKIPAEAQINAVAVLDQVNGLLNAPYDRSVDGDLATLTITVNTLQVQVEYYDLLHKTGSSRQVEFEWAGGYAVDSLEVNFLAPVGATDVRLTPSPVSSAPGQDGLMNYRLQATSLPADENYAVVVRYERSSDDLSISSLPVEPATTPGLDTPGRMSLTSVLPWILGGLGILLVAAGIVGYFVWQSGGREVPRRKHRVARENAEQTDLYCHQCGKRAQESDTFCRTCGTRLRTE
jgi:hypothetical protein